MNIDDIKKMKYPTRQEMREAIWWLIGQLEKTKREDRERLKIMQESWNRTLKQLNLEPVDFGKIK